jgi:hypothetical protein
LDEADNAADDRKIHSNTGAWKGKQMTSEKQMLANRTNCLKSTGPRTSEGKWAVSQNALRHGLRSSRVVVIGEDRAEYEQFRNELLDQLSPFGLLESQLADQIAVCLWRLRRANCLESQVFDHLQTVFKKNHPAYFAPPPRQLRYKTFDLALDAWLKTEDGRMYLEKRWPADPECPSPIETFDKFWKNTFADDVDDSQDGNSPQFQDNTNADPEQTVSNPVDIAAASSENAVEMAKETTDEIEPLGPAVAEDMANNNVLLKFSRYETHLQRTLYRAMTELRRLQDIRSREMASVDSDMESVSEITKQSQFEK